MLAGGFATWTCLAWLPQVRIKEECPDLLNALWTRMSVDYDYVAFNGSVRTEKVLVPIGTLSSCQARSLADTHHT